jgi:hypothetical protein
VFDSREAHQNLCSTIKGLGDLFAFPFFFAFLSCSTYAQGEAKWHPSINAVISGKSASARKIPPPFARPSPCSRTLKTGARKVELQIERGEALGKDLVPLSTLIERYKALVAPAKKGYKQELLRLDTWLKHPYAKRDASSLKPADIAIYLWRV